IECYRDILALDTAHDNARRSLERHLEQGPFQVEVAGILEPIYAHIEEWRKLIEVHEIQLSRAREREAKVGLLLRIGELYAGKLGDAEKAFSSYSRAFREDPTSDRARGELERIATIQESWAELTKLYERAAE